MVQTTDKQASIWFSWENGYSLSLAEFLLSQFSNDPFEVDKVAESTAVTVC